MKIIASLLIILSTTYSLASTIDTYECLPSGPNVLYEDTFHVIVNKGGPSELLYSRVINYRGQNIKTEYVNVRGCSHATLLKNPHPNFDVQVVCSDDGENGFVDINTNSMTGEIYFYMPQIGYSERTSLEITCRRL